MKFTKMHGLGNDFILLEKTPAGNLPALAKRLCDRRTGIGADGLMLLHPSDTADVRMQLFNSDGSEAEMCGNGIRCFARYAKKFGGLRGKTFNVETLAGIMKVELLSDKVRINMGKPFFDRKDIPMTGEGDYLQQQLEVKGRELTASAIRLGVPHAVIFVPQLDERDVYTLGPAIERLPLFPARTNVNFAHVIDQNTVEVRTWERGCGATLACGTGSSSVAVCCAKAGLTGREVEIRLALGSLLIQWAESGDVFMTGPAEFVYSGEIDVK